MSPEWRSNPGFGTQKMCCFPLKRGVPSIAVTHSKIMWKFFPGSNFVSSEWRCPMNRGFPGAVPLQSCPAINKTHLQRAAGSTCSLLCSLSLTGYAFFFFFTKRLDVIFICKNKNKNTPEELLMGLSPSQPLSKVLLRTPFTITNGS